MKNNTYCTKIFDPIYSYMCAIRMMGEQHDLKMMLEAIDNEDLITYTQEFEKVYPIRTLFHKYKETILVLTYGYDTFAGQVFRGGTVAESFDIFKDADKLKSLVETSGDELTVIDYLTGRQIKPSYDTIVSYANTVIEVDRAMSEHQATIDAYRQEFKDFKKESELLYCTSPGASYKRIVNLIENCIETAVIAFRENYSDFRYRLESHLLCNSLDESKIKMFGLYVYVLKYAADHKRFLRRGSKTLSLCFNQTLSEMRKFIAANEGIVDKYIGYMELTRNERENLIFLLSEEGMMTSKNIGDDLFC